MKHLNDIPKGQTTEQLTTLVNDRQRDLSLILDGMVSNPAESDLDMGKHRIVGLADPVEDLDSVNLRTLRKFGSGGQQTVVESAPNAVSGTASFTVPRQGYGILALEAFCSKSGPVTFNALSIDEADIDWYGTANVTASATAIAPVISGSSRYGRAFSSGDFIIWIDFTSVLDQQSHAAYACEICKITAIGPTGNMTLARGQFGTPIVAHTNKRFYRLIDKTWSPALSATKPRQSLELAWANKCVPLVISGSEIENLIPAPDSGIAIPGFRTLAGAEYTLGNPGAVTLGGTSVLRLSVAGWHSIRNMFFEFDGAAGAGSGSAGDTVITLAYISPDRAKAYQVATFTILNGSRQSYTAAQQNTRFPPMSTWPPHANLSEMVGALDADGVLQNGFSLDPTSVASIQEDGEIDYIVTANATTPGTSLRGTVQI